MRVLDLVHDRYWRAFELGIGVTSDEAGQGPVYYPPPPPPPLKHNPGPPPRGSISGGRSTGGGGHPVPPPESPPDIFGAYIGPEVDAAKQLVQQWMALMGYPTGMDANALTLDILQQGLAEDAQAADTWLFLNVATKDQQASHMWAQFGLDPTTYQQRKDSMDSLFQSLLGQTGADWQAGWTYDPAKFGTDLNTIYYQALKGSWNQTQVLQAIQQSGSDTVKQLVAAQPWLLQGQGFQQASQTYASLYGSAPVDTATLAGWFRFNTGTQTLSRSSRGAIETAAPLAQAGTEAR